MIEMSDDAVERALAAELRKALTGKQAVCIDPDAIRQRLSGYRDDPSEAESEAHYLRARAIADRLCRLALESDRHDTVILTAGASGSGKTEVYVEARRTTAAGAILIDGTLARPERARATIARARGAGKSVVVAAIYAPIEDAWDFARTRARRVPTPAMARRHRARATIAGLLEGDPALAAEIVLNRRTLGRAQRLVFRSRPDLVAYARSVILSDREIEAAIACLEGAATTGPPVDRDLEALARMSAAGRVTVEPFADNTAWRRLVLRGRLARLGRLSAEEQADLDRMDAPGGCSL